MTVRYPVDDLRTLAADMLGRAGAEPAKARIVADILVEGELLGHDTHGLALLGPYVEALRSGSMAGRGEPEVVADKPAALVWDGKRLPGPWLTVTAIETALERARKLGTASVAIRRAHHIACLAAYLEAPARAGYLIEILSSDPSVASVAPYGGTRAVFTPNPIAVGIPTSGEPILIDVSTSVTTNGMSNRLKAAGKTFEHAWLLDNRGRPANDPAVFDTTPPGTIQLLGGIDAGHKGYGLTLFVEAATSALAGYGRADGETGWGASVLVRISDAEAFGGRDAFDRQMDWIAKACLDCDPVDPARPVRLPGARGLALKREALARGLALNPLVATGLTKVLAGAGLAMPPPA
jgi:L-lactate dehydrogenase